LQERARAPGEIVCFKTFYFRPTAVCNDTDWRLHMEAVNVTKMNLCLNVISLTVSDCC